MYRKLISIFAILTICSQAMAQKTSWGAYYIELPIVGFPYVNDAVDVTGGFIPSYMNPSMDASIKLSEDFYTASHILLKKYIKSSFWSVEAIAIFDCLSTSLPLSYAWTHEEFHRATMTHRGVNSFNEILLFPIGASTISVSREKDELLAAMCDTHHPDFVRLMSTGLEGQTKLVQEIQRKDFFYNRNLYNHSICLISVVNNLYYLYICSSGKSDKYTLKMTASEPTIEERDFTGMDLVAWAYELFNPERPYSDRGAHPSGVGIDRYILHNDLSGPAVKYLKKQYALEYLNLLNPMLLGRTHFYLGSTKRGDWYGNAAVRHYLTSYGDDIVLETLIQSPHLNSFVSLHNYNNNKHHFAGLEAGIVDKRVFDSKVGLSGSVQAWVQPESFDTSVGKLGGALNLKASFRMKMIEPYFETGIKSAGWVAGNEYLDSSFNANFGLRVNLMQKR